MTERGRSGNETWMARFGGLADGFGGARLPVARLSTALDALTPTPAAVDVIALYRQLCHGWLAAFRDLTVLLVVMAWHIRQEVAASARPTQDYVASQQPSSRKGRQYP